ncbi:glycosyltransferase [Deinococcus phoenicis]|uniref:glycosyltransferase n=1 Tax=Deinococcus phoenicis TaxID=1476583 RepID=UPI00054E1C7A|nr:nucleotide disphospho-sugar-binding domain-containing protein [Deinococcus phoenicis]
MTFFSDATELLRDLDFPCLFGEAAGSFDPGDWFRPETIAAHFDALTGALCQARPTLLLTHQLMLGPLLTARQQGLPLGVIGLAAPMFPLSGEHLEQARLTGTRAAVRYTQLLDIFDRATRVLSLPPDHVSPEYFSGEVFLLRSVPELELEASVLPEHVHYAGDLWWEPPGGDENLARFLERAQERPVVYLQPGRTFDEGSFTWALTCDLKEQYAVIIDTFRSDEEEETFSTDGNVLIQPYIPMGLVLPRATLMVSHSHTTAALAGLRFGVPHLVVPNGSGTEDIAQRLVAAGAARCAQASGVVAGARQVLGEHLRASPSLRTALQAGAASGGACRALEALG